MTFDRDGFYSELGRRMALLREHEGETQLELAEAIGLKRSTYANMERGRQRTPADVLWRVSRHYCVPVDRIMPEPIRRHEWVEDLESSGAGWSMPDMERNAGSELEWWGATDGSAGPA